MPDDPSDELRDVLSHYDLGELVSYERDQRGTVNTSYSIHTLKDGRSGQYFLRRYKSAIKHEEILFEHSLINHLVDHSRCPVARLHRTTEGSTFYMRPAADPGDGPCYYAIFDFLHGEDRYTWVDPHCTVHELENAGELLATFHAAVSSLVCDGMRAESKILDLLREIEKVWEESPARSKGTLLDRYLAENFLLVQKSIAETRAALSGQAIRSLPEVIIHSDFHPGNLVFDGEEICGLVDFDWSKVDLRLFDVALAVWYFSTSWADPRDGELRLEEVRTFLGAYQRTLLSASATPALSEDELTLMPHMLAAANIYVMYWGLRDYLARDVDPEEYIIYLKHSVSFIRWFNQETSRQGLTTVLAELPPA
jgi:homoserine kinase type II